MPTASGGVDDHAVWRHTGVLPPAHALSGYTVSSGVALEVADPAGSRARTIISGGTETVSSGGTDDGAKISGGTQLDYGLASGATIVTGSQVVEAGGTASGTIISGGTEIVSAGGTDDGAKISGGTQLDYGLASGATIVTGSQVVEAGGIASGTIISGGTETVSSGGTDDGAKISGGTQLDYGLASGATIVTGSQVVEAGGVASATIISGGTEIVSAGGTDDGAKISGGTQLDYGLASGATIFTGSQVVEAGGIASGTIISGGTEIVSSGGTDDGAKISGGTQLDYGLASGATIVTGSQVVEAGGTASGTTVSSGGTLDVLSGGLADPTTILSGGTEIVSAGGSDDGAKISGGTQLDYGLASGATIVTGSQVVEAGGTASGTIISGGTQLVDAGGSAAATTISGGTFEIASGGSAVGAISFAGTGGSLKIDGTVPSTVISGFAYGDVIDLAAVTFVSSGKVQLMSGNVLEVVEGGSSYNLQLNPSTSFAGEIFKLSADGAAGTDVTVGPPPPVETRIKSDRIDDCRRGPERVEPVQRRQRSQRRNDHWILGDRRQSERRPMGSERRNTGERSCHTGTASELTFDALTPGSENIYLQATDNGGATWSAWQGNGVAVTVAQSPPVVETPIRIRRVDDGRRGPERVEPVQLRQRSQRRNDHWILGDRRKSERRPMGSERKTGERSCHTGTAFGTDIPRAHSRQRKHLSTGHRQRRRDLVRLAGQWRRCYGRAVAACGGDTDQSDRVDDCRRGPERVEPVQLRQRSQRRNDHWILGDRRKSERRPMGSERTNTGERSCHTGTAFGTDIRRAHSRQRKHLSTGHRQRRRDLVRLAGQWRRCYGRAVAASGGDTGPSRPCR